MTLQGPLVTVFGHWYWGHQKVCSYDYGKEASSLGFDPLGCLPWERLDTSSAARLRIS